MKKLLLSFIFLLLLAASSFATVITVSSTTILNWTAGGTRVTLRIYPDHTFTTSTGQTILAGTSNGFYKIVNCTNSAGTVSCPSFTIDTTTDSNYVTVKYTAVLYDYRSVPRQTFFVGRVSHLLGSPVTWEQLRTDNLSNPPTLPPTYYTTSQSDAAYLKRASDDWNAFSVKSTPVGADTLIIEDSAGGKAKKRIAVSSLATLPGQGTQGSVFFAGVTGSTAENNAAFNWDNANTKLHLVDKTYNGTALTKSYFVLGTPLTTPISNNLGNTQNGAAAMQVNIAYEGDDTAIGISSQVDSFRTISSPGTGNKYVYGVIAGARNTSDVSSGRILIGVSGSADTSCCNGASTTGGDFLAVTRGNQTLTNNSVLYGVKGAAWGGHNGTTPTAIGGLFTVSNIGGGGIGNIGDATAVKAVIDASPPTTQFTGWAKGLSCDGWTLGAGFIQNGTCLYIGSSVDIGFNPHAIYSLSKSPAYFSGKLVFDSTQKDEGVTGNQTINKPSGTVNIAAGQNTVLISNSFVVWDFPGSVVTSIVLAVAQFNDATCSVKSVPVFNGSFRINMTANCTAETIVAFWVIN